MPFAWSTSCQAADPKPASGGFATQRNLGGEASRKCLPQIGTATGKADEATFWAGGRLGCSALGPQ